MSRKESTLLGNENAEPAPKMSYSSPVGTRRQKTDCLTIFPAKVACNIQNDSSIMCQDSLFVNNELQKNGIM